MRKIIDGKKYDTETAVLICEFGHLNIVNFSNGNPFGDSKRDTRQAIISLYRTQNGRFFAAADPWWESVGKVSGFSRYDGLCVSKWPGMLVIDADAARLAAEKQLNVDEFESFFGSVEAA